MFPANVMEMNHDVSEDAMGMGIFLGRGAHVLNNLVIYSRGLIFGKYYEIAKRCEMRRMQ